MFRFKGRIKGEALRQLEIEPAILGTATELSAAMASSAVAASVDTEEKILQFMTTCRASAKQKAMQLGGMAPDEADRQASDTCAAAQPAFRACLGMVFKTRFSPDDSDLLVTT